MAETRTEETKEQTERATLAQRYRAAYAKLPPGLQLTGLMLWMPVFFICLFCFCYINAFHAPTIKDAPVAVVGEPSAVTQLERTTGTMFAYHEVPDRAAADELVRDGDDIGALDLSDPARPALVVASAHSYQAANVAKQILTPVYAAQKQTLAVDDLAPLPAHDSYGMTTMYMTLSWCMGGYMLAMFIGLMGAPLRHRTRVAVILIGAAGLSFLANLLAGPVIGAVHGHFLQLWGIAYLWMVAIGLAVNGLSYFFGRFIAAPAVLVFLFLSIPSSGAAYPAFMLPTFFERLQPYVVGFGMTEMIKRTLYDVGEGYGKGFLLLGCYAVAGVVLMLVGKPWRQRREIGRILAGRTTMFMDAQGAAREAGIEERERVLAKYGERAHELAVAAEDEDRLATDVMVTGGRPIDGIERDENGPRH